MQLPFILLPFMAMSLIAFLLVEFKENRLSKLLFKTLTSLFFIGIAISSYLSADADPRYFLFIFFADVLCLCGDVLLVYQERNKAFFMGGLVSFLFAHIVFITIFSTCVPITIADFIWMAALTGGCVLFYRFSKLDLGKLKIPALVYLCVISFMVSKAVSLVFSGTVDLKAAYLAAMGALLFMTSDACLVVYDFSKTKHKRMRILNLITYYTGQAMIALSVFYMV